MRRLAPAFVVTISAVSACGGSKPPAPPTTEIAKPSATDDEPSRTPDEASSTEPQAEPVDPPTRLEDYPNVLNAKDSAGRAIFRAESGPGCYVELPFGPLKPGEQRPPGTPPPRKNVACPAAMKDPAYDACLGGTIHAKTDKSACVCFVMGNPPEVPRAISCPGK
jgi:hypothetical protein